MSDATNTQYPTIIVDNIREDGEWLQRIGYKVLRCIAGCFTSAARSIADAT